MRNKLVKEIRKSARFLFPERAYVEYTTDNNGSTVMTEYCIKKLVKDTKGHIHESRGKRLLNM